jgi:AcrR family transcriptional regulator
VLRDRDGENLREHLIATAARLIDERGSAGLAVRDIAREAQVADGALYNYFEDKEDLLAQALLAHVGTVMSEAPRLLPEAGTGTVAENLAGFIDRGLAVLIRVVPAFAGLLSQPKVLSRFHAMVGGGAAFGTPDAAAAEAAGQQPAEPGPSPAEPGPAGPGPGPSPADRGPAEPGPSEAEPGEPGPAEPGPGEAGPGEPGPGEAGPTGLPDLLTQYLRAEQRLGRIDPAADVEAASTLIVGAIHGQVLPRVVFAMPGRPISLPTGLGAQLADAAVRGLAPRPAPGTGGMGRAPTAAS